MKAPTRRDGRKPCTAPVDVRDDVKGVLVHLGFREIRPAETGAWTPTQAVGNQYGTTSETGIVRRKGKPTAQLVDAESGQTVAVARRSCSVES